MSRSYKKSIKFGTCSGNNTEFYRDRNRKERAVNRNHLRSLIAHYDIDTVNDLIVNIQLPYDDWDEPTDGHFALNWKDRNRYSHDWHGNLDYDSLEYFDNHIGRYVRNPHHNKIIGRRKSK